MLEPNRLIRRLGVERQRHSSGWTSRTPPPSSVDLGHGAFKHPSPSMVTGGMFWAGVTFERDYVTNVKSRHVWQD